jgi:hypothetical protein
LTNLKPGTYLLVGPNYRRTWVKSNWLIAHILSKHLHAQSSTVFVHLSRIGWTIQLHS